MTSVRHALLALLSEEAKYGERLRREFEATTGGGWPLNVGQAYTTLQHLKRDGLIESEGSANQGRAKSFRITDKGEQELSGRWTMPPDGTVPPHDQLVIMVHLALRVPNVLVHELIGSITGISPNSGNGGCVSRSMRQTRTSPSGSPSTQNCSVWTQSSAGSTRQTTECGGQRSKDQTPLVSRGFDLGNCLSRLNGHHSTDEEGLLASP